MKTQRWLTTAVAGTLLMTSVLASSPALAEYMEAARYYNQGVEYYTKGNTTLAIRLFEKAVAADPRHIDAHYNLGSLYYQTKQYEKAQREFRNATALSPNDSQARYSLALSLEKTRDYTEAIRELKQIPSDDRRYNQARRKIAELAPLETVHPVQETPTWKPAKTVPKTEPSSKKTGTPATKTGQSRTPVMEPNPKKVGQDALLDGDMSKVGKARPEDSKKTVNTFAKGFFGPTGMALGPGGDLYVANYSKNLIYKVGPRGDKTVFVEGEGLHGPIGLVVDPDEGNMYVANYLGNNITRISPMGKVSVLASGLNKPYNLLLDNVNRVLYVSEQETNTVCKINLAR